MVGLGVVLLGLCFGSFVNAFVWRYKHKKDWVRERSQCVNCHHELAPIDLIPVISWLALRGKCRYCHKKISIQYPLVELLTSALFLLSYFLWHQALTGINILDFIFWLVILTGLISLAIYDIRWMILPTKIIYTLLIIAVILAFLNILNARDPATVILNYIGGSLVGGGVFYLIYMLSKGKWIGGGDVRLGFLLGLIAASPLNSMLLLFMASIIGTLVSVTLIAAKKAKRQSLIPFGPFLILSMIIVELQGASIIHWYISLIS